MMLVGLGADGTQAHKHHQITAGEPRSGEQSEQCLHDVKWENKEGSSRCFGKNPYSIVMKRKN